MHRFARLAPPHAAGHRPGQIAALHVVLERHGTGCADGLCADHAEELRAAPADQLERLVVALLREALEAAPAHAARAAVPAAATGDEDDAGTATEPDEDFAGEF